jgi:hypothetical protein
MYSIVVKVYQDTKNYGIVGIKSDGIDESMRNVKAYLEYSKIALDFHKRLCVLLVATKGKKENEQ